jgi:hypothetical protein
MPKKNTVSVHKRLLSKTLARIEEQEEVEETPVVQDQPPAQESKPPKSVVIVDKPREAMILQEIPINTDKKLSEFGAIRLGVDRTGGSMFHCIVRSSYAPYLEWNRERRIRKVREFRQDLALNFDGYYLRLDQKSNAWPPLQSCKRELETIDNMIQSHFLDYIGKVINKNIVMLVIDQNGKLSPIPGTKIYIKSSPQGASNISHTKTNSPITYARGEPVFIFIIHLGGPAFELLGMRRNDMVFTLFPESHPVTREILERL